MVVVFESGSSKCFDDSSKRDISELMRLHFTQQLGNHWSSEA